MTIRTKEINPFQVNQGKIDFRTVINDYIEFSGEREKDVLAKIENSLQDSAKVWKETVRVNSEKEIESFYLGSEYIYEIMLAYYDPVRFNKEETYFKILNYVKRTPGKKVMEFGGGTGQLCLMMYFNSEKNVTYVDLPSRVMEFAKWRFRKYAANINCLEANIDSCNLGNDAYDCIVSDAVLEHVTNLEETIKSLSASLKFEGTFYLLFDTCNNDDFPMHISANKDVEKIMRENGLIRISDIIYIKSNRLFVRTKHFSFTISRYLTLIVPAIKHPKRALNYVFKVSKK